MKKFLVFLCAIILIFFVVGSASALMLTNGNLVTPIPEPAILFLLGTSLIGLATLGRKKFL
jgi:hypothetical protein